MTISPALIWNTAAIALGIVGGTLFLWAMFKDRPRGRLRCPKCWYDMKGVVEAPANVDAASPASTLRDPPWTCPECGKGIRAHKHLKRTRRRRRIAAIALVAVLISFHTPRLRHAFTRDWEQAIPSYVLVLWPGSLGEFEESLASIAGAKAAVPSPVLARIQDQAVARLMDGDFNRLESWILTKRLRWMCRERGIQFLSRADLATLDRLNATMFTVRNEDIAVEALASACREAAINLVDKRARRTASVDWRNHQKFSYPSHLSSQGLPARADPSDARISLTSALNGILIDGDWSYVAGEVQLAEPAALPRCLAIYDIHDLVGWGLTQSSHPSAFPRPRDEIVVMLIDVITQNVLYEWWTDNGGDAASILPFGDRLIVHAPPRMHAEIRSFLGTLRETARSRRPIPDATLRDMETLTALQGRIVPLGEPAPRTVGDAAALIERFTQRRVVWRFNYWWNPELLNRAIDVEQPFNVQGFCDALPPALEKEGVFAKVTWTFHDDAIVIGTTLPTDTRLYSLKNLHRKWLRMTGSNVLSWYETGQKVIDAITTSVDANFWMDNRGELGRARLVGDILIIDATPAMHARVGQLLQELAVNPPAPVVEPPRKKPTLGDLIFDNSEPDQ